MMILNIGTVAVLMIVMWAFGFVTGAFYKRRCKRKVAAG